MFFIQLQDYLLIVNLIRLTGEHEAYLQFTLPGILRRQVKGQVMTVGNQVA